MMEYNLSRLPNRMFELRWQKVENQLSSRKGKNKYVSEINREFYKAAWRSYILLQKDEKRNKNRNCAT